MRMPTSYLAGAAFAALVEEADILRRDGDDETIPTAMTLWYRLDDREEQQVRAFCRTLLWLGACATHTASVVDVTPPACLGEWIADDIETLPSLRRSFGAQLVDDIRFGVTDNGRAALKAA